MNEIRPFSDDISYGNDSSVTEAPVEEVSALITDQVDYPDGFREVTVKDYRKIVDFLGARLLAKPHHVAMWLEALARDFNLNSFEKTSGIARGGFRVEDVLKVSNITKKDLIETKDKGRVPWEKDLRGKKTRGELYDYFFGGPSAGIGGADRAGPGIETEAEKNNTIPHGEFYHKDKGWY